MLENSLISIAYIKSRQISQTKPHKQADIPPHLAAKLKDIAK
jgi:hypothetical protein